MKMDNYIRLIAGSFILLSLFMAWFHSPWWLGFTAFVGFNLVQSSITGFCPMENILEKLGVKR